MQSLLSLPAAAYSTTCITATAETATAAAGDCAAKIGSDTKVANYLID